MLAVVCHDIVGGDEGRHVTTRLGGQIGIQLPVVLVFGSHRLVVSAPSRCPVALDGLLDVLGPTVVGGDHQVPVAEDLVEILQQMGGGIRCFHGVAALIDERVDGQTILFGGSRHELPETAGTHARHRFRVQRRLDDRQVFQFQRNLIGLERLLEDRHIEVERAQHITHGVAQTACITVDETLHDVVVRQFHDGGDALQSLDIHLFGVLGILVCHLAVAGCSQISLRHIEVHQAVEIIGHGCGELNDFLVAVLIRKIDFVFGTYLGGFFLFFFFAFYVNVVDFHLGLHGSGK